MSDPTPPTTYGVGQYVASEAHVAMLPRVWRADGTKRGALCVPGWGGNALTEEKGLFNFGVDTLLAQHGNPSFCGDYGTGATAGKTWGNDTSQSRLGTLFSYAQSAFGVKSDKFVIWGGSMGTLQALNYARNNPTKVAALAIQLPAVDLDDAYTAHAAAITAYLGTDADTNIQAAYGGSDAAYQAAKATHNPNTAPNIATAGAQAIPTQLWYSTDDPLITPSIVTAYAAAINAAGGNCTATSMGACGGHSMSVALTLDPSPIVTWLAQYV